MTQHLPSFRDPPVIETALSIQFKRLPGFRNAHLGLFWATVKNEYPLLADADPITNQIEKFDGAKSLLPSRPRIHVGPIAPSRLQMMSEDKCKMLQLQNDRFVYNWRRFENDSSYPRWSSTKPGLFEYWSRFERFAEESGLGQATANQWEVVYVNHLVKGVHWSTPEEWKDLVPGLVGDTSRVLCGPIEAWGSNAHFVLGENRGRLHVDLHHAYRQKHGAEDSDEILNLQLTARGPVSLDGNVQTLEDGLDMGHEAIVNTFAQITGEQAHDVWGRES